MRSTVLAYCAWLLLAGVYGAAAETLPLPPDSGDLVGEPLSVAARHEDTLIDIARRHGLGYEEIVNANPGVDPWLPGAGVDVALPTRRLLPMASVSRPWSRMTPLVSCDRCRLGASVSWA